MRYRKLGRTGLAVSEICLGTMTFGGDGFWKVIGALEQETVTKLTKTAFDQGVTFIDTANIYSNGMSEQVLAGAIKDLPRDELVIATKLFGRMGAYGAADTPDEKRRAKNTNLWGLSRKHVFDAIDASLERLELDYVDLYQVHAFDPLTPLEETLEALDEVVRSGRVRYIGLCNYAAWQIAKALGVSERSGLARFESAQMYYSIAGRDLEREVVPLAQDQELAILPWSPLAGGLLSGKFTRDSGAIGDAKNASVAQVALAWLLHKKHVTSVIIGAKTEKQLIDNIAATKVELTSEDMAKLDDVSKLKPEYPGWMLERQGGDRTSGIS
jgi:aryl-alcohol dehydrogenase-like predicted oxidoreductase